MQRTGTFHNLNQGLLILMLLWVFFTNNSNSPPVTPEIYPPVPALPSVPETLPTPSNPNDSQQAPTTPLPSPAPIPLPSPTPNIPPSIPNNPANPSNPNNPNTPGSNTKVDKVIKVALSWVGKEFNPRVSAQCAFFVRRVFKDAGYPLPVSRQSIDPRNSQSPGMAHSLCGVDVGTRVTTLEQMKPGCIAAFERTYGSWGPGYITHVGIYAGGWRSSSGIIIPKGEMIDRNTRGGPVRRISVKTYGNKFKGGFCPHNIFNGANQ